MTYPNSADVIAGQPTAADHYNNLRKDALNLGNLPADAVNLGSFLARHSEFIDIQYLATNRLRIPYATDRPPSLMINGFMLKAEANVDLPASLFSGAAATWYIFAVRNAGSTTFTLTVNTSAAEPPDQRLIGSCVWNGSSVVAIQCKVNPTSIFTQPDYDSGWFSVGNGT
jgi:hypothetical protein